MNVSGIHHQAYIDAFSTAIENSVLNRLLRDPVLAQGTTTTKFKFTNAFDYMLAGQVYYKAATDDVAAPGSGANTGSGEYRKSLICIDSAGTVTLVHGTVAASQGAAALPSPTANTVPVGYLEIPASFTSGSTNVTAGMIKRYAHTVNVTYT